MIHAISNPSSRFENPPSYICLPTLISPSLISLKDHEQGNDRFSSLIENFTIFPLSVFDREMEFFNFVHKFGKGVGLKIFLVNILGVPSNGEMQTHTQEFGSLLSMVHCAYL